MIRSSVDELQPLGIQVLEVGFPCEVIECLSFRSGQSHIPAVVEEIRAHTWPVGDVICARAEFRKLAVEHTHQARRGASVEKPYGVVSRIEDLLNTGTRAVVIVVVLECWWTRIGAYMEKARAGAHYEPCLVEVGDTGSIVVWLSVVQMRARIGHVHHGRKIRIPRAILQGSELVHNWSSAPVRDTSDAPRRPRR